MTGLQVQAIADAGSRRHDQDPAVAGVGHEEIAGAIERQPGRRAHDGRSEHGAHARRRTGYGCGPGWAGDDRGESAQEGGQGDGGDTHRAIMPVAPTAHTRNAP